MIVGVAREEQDIPYKREGNIANDEKGMEALSLFIDLLGVKKDGAICPDPGEIGECVRWAGDACANGSATATDKSAANDEQAKLSHSFHGAEAKSLFVIFETGRRGKPSGCGCSFWVVTGSQT